MTANETPRQRIDRLESELRHAYSNGSDQDVIDDLHFQIEDARLAVKVASINDELEANK